MIAPWRTARLILTELNFLTNASWKSQRLCASGDVTRKNNRNARHSLATRCMFFFVWAVYACSTTTDTTLLSPFLLMAWLHPMMLDVLTTLDVARMLKSQMDNEIPPCQESPRPKSTFLLSRRRTCKRSAQTLPMFVVFTSYGVHGHSIP